MINNLSVHWLLHATLRLSFQDIAAPFTLLGKCRKGVFFADSLLQLIECMYINLRANAPWNSLSPCQQSKARNFSGNFGG